MAITRQSFADDTATLLQQTYQQNWLPTNWEGTAVPKLPAGMTLYIGGVPYIVDTADYEPSGSPSNGLIYIKVTPNVGDGGATADGVFTNTFSGTWNEAYNAFFDGTSMFLNFFCTLTTGVYSNKGFWLNWRERKLQAVSGNLIIDGKDTKFNIAVNSGNTTIISSNLVEKNILGVSVYTKMYEWEAIGCNGSVKIDFELKSNTYSKVYINGVAVGAEIHGGLLGTYVAFTQNINFINGDLIQIYLHGPSSAYEVNIKNVILKVSETFSKLVSDYLVLENIV